MLGCLEVLLTAGEIVLKILVVVFIPLFLCGTFTALTEGSIGDPCVLGIILFYGVVLLVALGRIRG